jgi:hypothetical protein
MPATLRHLWRLYPGIFGLTGILLSHEPTITHQRRIKMGVFRYTDKYTAPKREQRERYMTGKCEEHHFGPEGQIVLIEYHEAAYLKDEIDDIRILYTGPKDKLKARDEAKRLEGRHERKSAQKNLFTPRKTAGNNPESADHKSG